MANPFHSLSLSVLISLHFLPHFSSCYFCLAPFLPLPRRPNLYPSHLPFRHLGLQCALLGYYSIMMQRC